MAFWPGAFAKYQFAENNNLTVGLVAPAFDPTATHATCCRTGIEIVAPALAISLPRAPQRCLRCAPVVAAVAVILKNLPFFHDELGVGKEEKREGAL